MPGPSSPHAGRKKRTSAGKKKWVKPGNIIGSWKGKNRPNSSQKKKKKQRNYQTEKSKTA